jgi:hypothetical protein
MVAPSFDSLVHWCADGVCSVTNDACGLRASLGGDLVPMELPAGDYLALAEFQSQRQGLLSLSLSCSSALTDSSLRIEGAGIGATSARGNVEIWDTQTRRWQQLVDQQWTKQDAQVVCRQLGFAFADNAPDAPLDPRTLTRVCNGSETTFDQCPEVIPDDIQWEPAFASCSDKQSITIVDRTVVQSNNYWGLISPMFVSQTYISNPVDTSIFSHAADGSISFSLDVIDDPTLDTSAGQFLVDQRTGEILARPLRPGVVGLVLTATDDVGFSTAVYFREIELQERFFMINPNAGWSPDVLVLPDNITINTTTAYFGPSHYGFDNDALFINHNLSSTSVVRFTIDYENEDRRSRRQGSSALSTYTPGQTLIDPRTGDIGLVALNLGRYAAEYKVPSAAVARTHAHAHAYAYALLPPSPLLTSSRARAHTHTHTHTHKTHTHTKHTHTHTHTHTHRPSLTTVQQSFSRIGRSVFSTLIFSTQATVQGVEDATTAVIRRTRSPWTGRSRAAATCGSGRVPTATLP